MNFTRRSMVAASVSSALALPALGQTYPSRRISIVVPFPAGGPADVAARVMQPLVQKALGATVIVENFGGAGGAIGVSKVLGAPADGYTLLMATVAEPILPPLTMTSVRYKPTDLLLVSPLSSTSIALVARPDLRLQSLDEFLRRVRDTAKPPLSYATPGSGTLYHLMGEHFKALTGARMLHVSYKGLAPAVNDLLGGQVDVAFLPLAGNTIKLVESGKLRPLAVSAAPDTPSDLPRLADMPGLKDFVYSVWTGVFVARSTPGAVVERIRSALDESLRGPEFAAYTREVGGVARERAASANEANALFASEARRLEATFRAVKLETD